MPRPNPAPRSPFTRTEGFVLAVLVEPDQGEIYLKFGSQLWPDVGEALRRRSDFERHLEDYHSGEWEGICGPVRVFRVMEIPS